MKTIAITLLATLILGAVSALAAIQPPGPRNPQDKIASPAPAQTRVIGEVVAVDRQAVSITVKTGAGENVLISVGERTVCLLVAPGEESLEKAARIAFAEIEAGDRVLARVEMGEDKKSASARQLILMRKADIQEKQKRERETWRERSISGVVKSLDPQSREIMLKVRGREGSKTIRVRAAEGVEFRRYAQDSFRFSDATPSSFGELKAGDQLRALGEKSADGALFTAEAVVSGSFVTFGATVTAINPQNNQIEATVLGTKRLLNIFVGRDSMLRIVPREMAAKVAISWQRQDDTTSQASGSSFNFQEMIERLPPTALGNMKPGDVIAFSGTASSDQSRVNVTTLVSGIDAVLNAWPKRQRQVLDASTGLPASALNLAAVRP